MTVSNGNWTNSAGTWGTFRAATGAVDGAGGAGAVDFDFDDPDSDEGGD